jgi:O-antigen ligase
MSPSLLLYLIAGALVPTIGFAAVSTGIGYWVVLVSRHGIVEGRLWLPRYPQILVPLFLVVVALGMLTWQGPVDLKDPLALILFFAVVPALVCAQALRDDDWLDAARRTFFLAFVVASVAIIAWTLWAGVDWQRNYFLFRTLHKNAVGPVYEVLLLAVTLHQPTRGRRLLCAAAGLVCLVLVGSKTALVLSLAAVAILLFRWLGAAALVLAAVPAVTISLGSLNLESPVRTVVFRFVLWAQAWYEITASPSHLWLGAGPGAFAAVAGLPGLVGIQSPHNMLLQWWHSYGLLGLLLFSGFFAWLLRRFGVTSSPFLAAFWLFNLHALFDVGWVKGPGFVASVALGLGIADVARRERVARSSPGM